MRSIAIRGSRMVSGTRTVASSQDNAGQGGVGGVALDSRNGHCDLGPSPEL